jgi:hypothetical protein
MNQMQGTGVPPTMSSGPKSFFQVWIDALTKPNEATFAEMAASPNAKATTAYIWIFIGLLVELFFTSLVQGAFVREALRQQGLGGNLPAGGAGFTLITAVCGAPILAVIGTIFFAIGVAVVQWVAKMFGGRGTFDQLAYAFAAIGAPYALVASVFVLLGAIPFVGLCFRLVLGLAGIYVFVLEVMAVKGVNQFGWGPAFGSVVIPGLVVGLLCCCLVFGLAAALGTAFGNILNTINQSLTTP